MRDTYHCPYVQTPKIYNPQINSALGLIMDCQCRFSLGKKKKMHLSGEWCWCWGRLFMSGSRRFMRNILPTFPFCCQLKRAVENRHFFFKEKKSLQVLSNNHLRVIWRVLQHCDYSSALCCFVPWLITEVQWCLGNTDRESRFRNENLAIRMWAVDNSTGTTQRQVGNVASIMDLKLDPLTHNLHFNKISRWFFKCTLKFEKHLFSGLWIRWRMFERWLSEYWTHLD